MSTMSVLRSIVPAVGIAMAFTACLSFSNVFDITDREIAQIAKVLTCPERQGQLIRQSDSTDGMSCTYGLQTNKAVEVELRMVPVDPRSQEETIGAIEKAWLIDSPLKESIDQALRSGRGVKTKVIEWRGDGGVSRTFSVRFQKPSSFHSLGLVLRGPQSGPQVIGVLKSTQTISQGLSVDFKNLVETASRP